MLQRKIWCTTVAISDSRLVRLVQQKRKWLVRRKFVMHKFVMHNAPVPKPTAMLNAEPSYIPQTAMPCGHHELQLSPRVFEQKRRCAAA